MRTGLTGPQCASMHDISEASRHHDAALRIACRFQMCSRGLGDVMVSRENNSTTARVKQYAHSPLILALALPMVMHGATRNRLIKRADPVAILFLVMVTQFPNSYFGSRLFVLPLRQATAAWPGSWQFLGANHPGWDSEPWSGPG